MYGRRRPRPLAAPERLRSHHGQVGTDLHAVLTTLIERLPQMPTTPSSDAAWALMALSMGTFLCQNLVQDTPSSTTALVDQLSMLLSAPR